MFMESIKDRSGLLKGTLVNSVINNNTGRFRNVAGNTWQIAQELTLKFYFYFTLDLAFWNTY